MPGRKPKSTDPTETCVPITLGACRHSWIETNFFHIIIGATNFRYDVYIPISTCTSHRQHTTFHHAIFNTAREKGDDTIPSLSHIRFAIVTNLERNPFLPRKRKRPYLRTPWKRCQVPRCAKTQLAQDTYRYSEERKKKKFTQENSILLFFHTARIFNSARDILKYTFERQTCLIRDTASTRNN